MKTLYNKNVLAAVLFTALSLFVIVTSLFLQPRAAGASAPMGLWAQVATSSTLTVTSASNTFSGFGTTTREQNYTCASRIITTGFNPIRISFASLSSTTLSTTVGYLMASSTSKEFDGGIYGCGYMTIRDTLGTSQLTLTETR